MSDWYELSRPEKILRANDAISYLRNLRKTYPYTEVYDAERDQHYPILGLIARWVEVLEELDHD